MYMCIHILLVVSVVADMLAGGVLTHEVLWVEGAEGESFDGFRESDATYLVTITSIPDGEGAGTEHRCQ